MYELIIWKCSTISDLSLYDLEHLAHLGKSLTLKLSKELLI